MAKLAQLVLSMKSFIPPINTPSLPVQPKNHSSTVIFHRCQKQGHIARFCRCVQPHPQDTLGSAASFSRGCWHGPVTSVKRLKPMVAGSTMGKQDASLPVVESGSRTVEGAPWWVLGTMEKWRYMVESAGLSLTGAHKSPALPMASGAAIQNSRNSSCLAIFTDQAIRILAGKEVDLDCRIKAGPHRKTYTALIEGLSQSKLPQGILVARVLTDVKKGCAPASVLNASQMDITIQPHTELAMTFLVDQVVEPTDEADRTHQGEGQAEVYLSQGQMVAGCEVDRSEAAVGNKDQRAWL